MGMIDYTRKASRARALAGDVPTWITNSKRAPYILSVLLSCPDWVDRADLKFLKRAAAMIPLTSGIEHVLDHRIPLNHPHVCGLTVPYNLQIIPRAVNGAKGNTWMPDQMELPL